MDEQRVKVLLIEDNPQDAQVMQDALAASAQPQFDVTWANRLARGLEHLAGGGLDLILTDLDLSDSKGLETLATVHAQAGGVPIVVLTSSDNDRLSVQALQLGAQDYLVKGYVHVYPDLLVRSMRYALERWRSGKELLRLASLPEQNPDPIIETDVAGAVTYLNPAARAQFPDLPSAGAEHPLMKNLRDVVAAFHAEGKTALLIRELAWGGKTFEHRISYHPESNLIRSYMVDITARKQMEERERELTAAVTEAAVAEGKRAAQLVQALQELKRTQAMLIQAEKMSAVGQLAGGIAHEVKNPLNIILQSVNYLEPELTRENGEAVEILGVIRDAVMTADKIIHGLLDFSKPARLELKPVDISAVIDASLILVQNQLAEKKIGLIKEIAPGLPQVSLDANQMKQVFINLFLNAFQAMPKGGQLFIRSYLKPLRAPGPGVGERKTDRFRVGQTALICEVEDTGAGIPSENLSKVFNPFFTTKAPGEGVGLGLSISTAIVERHDGVVHLESEEGCGTKVVVMLPVESRGATGGKEG